MTRRIPPTKRQQIKDLRVQLNLSAPAIARKVGVSNFTVYKVLKKMPPWSGVIVRHGKRATWTGAETLALKNLYPSADQQDVQMAIPNRAWTAIVRQASALKIRRPLPGTRLNTRAVHPTIRKLRALREAQRMTRPKLAAKLGYHINQILGWELGKTQPGFHIVHDWAQILGMDLALVKR